MNALDMIGALAAFELVGRVLGLFAFLLGIWFVVRAEFNGRGDGK